MEFFWEWDRGPIGATATGGAAIAFADRAVGAITPIRATIQDIHQEGDTHRITGHRFPANLHITADTHRTMGVSHPITAKNRPIMGAENLPTGADLPIVVEAVSHRVAETAVAEVNHPAEGAVAEANLRVEAGNTDCGRSNRT